MASPKTGPPPAPAWCLIGNVVEERAFGPGGEWRSRGTRHFSPGAKLYCLPPQWGDGYQRVRVLGRHRGPGQRLVELVVPYEVITNWRASLVYKPAPLRWFKTNYVGPPWTEERATAVALLMKKREDEGWSPLGAV